MIRLHDLSLGGHQVGSTATDNWALIDQYPDFIAEGSSDQKTIMEAICTVKKATFDGVNCVGGDPDASGEVSSCEQSWRASHPTWVWEIGTSVITLVRTPAKSKSRQHFPLNLRGAEPFLSPSMLIYVVFSLPRAQHLDPSCGSSLLSSC